MAAMRRCSCSLRLRYQGAAPYAVDLPAEPLEDFLTEPVAVASDLGGVVHPPVTFDAQRKPSGQGGVLDADVYAVTGGADLRDGLVAP